jgi:serine/threonine protein kinase
MTLSAVKITMLYCPKCQHTYETGSQRFCSNDGVRLLLASAKSVKPTGVFSALLGKTAARDGNPSSATKFEQFKPVQPSIPAFIQPEASEHFRNEPAARTKSFDESENIIEIEHQIDAPRPESVLEIEPQAEPLKKEAPVSKPLARIIKPSEIPSGTASVGNRKTNPTGRLALSWQQPKILLGQTIKGRYYIVELLGQDEVSFSYLAEDRIVPTKKVFVRVFMDEDPEDNFSNRIFAEERVSLSHINHPNIASVIDSGELPEGKPFIVSEYMDGKTVKDMLATTGQFNASRTARIIRQASYALSEAHQNGVLHRNLKPENVFLTLTDSGTEQVKLTNFGILYDKINEANLPYKSPEQIEGKLSNYASDIYSLAVIAYQMLTNRLPFNAATENALLKAQREGLQLMPTNFRLDVPPQVDEILEKALSRKSSERFPKARDFGDAFFNALTAVAPWEKSEATPVEEEIEILPSESEEDILELNDSAIVEEPKTEPETAFSAEPETETEPEEPELISEVSPAAFDRDEEVFEDATADEAEAATETEELPWEKRSPDALKTASPNWLLLAISALGLIVFLGVWYYFLNRPTTPAFVQQPANQIVETPAAETNTTQPNLLPIQPIDIEIPPPARTNIQPPANSIYFENSKQNLRGEIAKNFLGFSLYYPSDWTKTASENNFLDVSKTSVEGLPIKKVIVTRYDSRGTFNIDQPLFKGLKEKSDKDLNQILEIYQVISAGEMTIQENRWKAYEVKFQGGLTANTGEKMQIWGRRFWIPVQRPGMKSGFVITMLATSLSTDVSSVDDVAKDDELKQILDTFEPATSN